MWFHALQKKFLEGVECEWGKESITNNHIMQSNDYQ